jgi:hypothetical protein
MKTGRRITISMIGAAMAIMILLMGGVVKGVIADTFHHHQSASGREHAGRGRGHNPAEEQQTRGGLRPRYTCEYFNDFIFPVKDERGESRMLLCDIVLELNEGEVIHEDRTGIRKIIFGASRSVGPASADIREMKQRLSVIIKDAVNKSVGRAVVKDVQMTTFLLL